MRSSVNPEVVRDDGVDLFKVTDAAALSVPATFLCAPRGMVDDPNPMQPLSIVQAWAAQDPERRRAIEVPDVNHYTIAWGHAGRRGGGRRDAVAAQLSRRVAAH